MEVNIEKSKTLEKEIAFLNGSLKTLEILNNGLYTGNTFYFCSINNYSNNIEKSIIEHLKLANWSVELKENDSFFSDLDLTLKEYCTSFLHSIYEEFDRIILNKENTVPKLIDKINYEDIRNMLYNSIEKIISQSFTVYTVRLSGKGWYEATYKDFLFECDNKYYYLHFGTSD